MKKYTYKIIFLRATIQLLDLSLALNTFPQVPDPIFSNLRYYDKGFSPKLLF